MVNITPHLLQQIPYISHIPKDGRSVVLHPYYDHEKNEYFLYHPVGETLHTLWTKPIEMSYWSPYLVNSKIDVHIELFDVIAKHYSFEHVVNEMFRIESDIMNCSTIVGKYFLYMEKYSECKNNAISNMVVTDLEYYFGNIRSLFDLIQSIIKYLWYKEKKKNLPDSFDKMVNKSKVKLKEKYDLSDSLINYYSNSKSLFSFCRKVRNGIIHSGRDIRIVFCMEDGFGLTKGKSILKNVPFEENIWPKQFIKQNNIVSILALYSFINIKILDNLSELAITFLKSFEPLPSLSENCNLYQRGFFVHHLVKAHQYLDLQWVKVEEVDIFSNELTKE